MDLPGSSEQWRDWFRQHGSRLLLYARQQTRSQADAEDVLQDAVVRVWKYAREHGEGEPSLPATFLAIRRCAIDLARKNQRRLKREDTAAIESGDPVEWFSDPVEAKEKSRTIQEAIRKLSPEYQEVITMKIWGGLTFAKIAEILDIPQNTAASRYRYALANLRRSLAHAEV